jgi:hypothetical protein
MMDTRADRYTLRTRVTGIPWLATPAIALPKNGLLSPSTSSSPLAECRPTPLGGANLICDTTKGRATDAFPRLGIATNEEGWALPTNDDLQSSSSGHP